MHDPHALDALRLIAPLRPAAHVPESDLSAALKDARRALDAGQSADSIFSALNFGLAVSAAGSAQDPFGGRSPGITNTGSEPSVAATLSYVRAAPLARLDPLAPSWARSLKPTTTRGGIGIFGEETGSTYWFPVKVEPYSRDEYEAELDDAKGDRRREKADSNEERDKEHAAGAFRQQMQAAVASGKRGLAFLKQGKTKGKQLDDYTTVRWRDLYRRDDNSKSWAHVQTYICEQFKGRDDGGAYWLFAAEARPQNSTPPYRYKHGGVLNPGRGKY